MKRFIVGKCFEKLRSTTGFVLLCLRYGVCILFLTILLALIIVDVSAS
jgi:hypothetical protein